MTLEKQTLKTSLIMKIVNEMSLLNPNQDPTLKQVYIKLLCVSFPKVLILT